MVTFSRIINRAFQNYSKILRPVVGKRKFKILALQKQIKLDLGSGPKRGINGWTTIDIADADINWNLKDGIPLPSESVTEIYSSHLLEHLEFTEVISILTEANRIMSPNAKIRLCLPNSRLYIEAYINGKLLKPQSDMYQPALTNTNSLMDQVNYIAYMGGEHKIMFDEENIVAILRLSGFSNIQISKFDSSYDDPTRKPDSMYVIAKK